jgi:Uma2 family endonuclease
MSAAPAAIPLEEYLTTDYEPDCDYVDGSLEERNVGKQKHSRTQFRLGAWFAAREKELGMRGLTEQRVQVQPRRVHIPDVCLVATGTKDEVLQEPPILWVEILSPDDHFNRIQKRVNDALQFGVPTIWIIDPYSTDAWIVTPQGGTQQATDGILRCANPPLELPLAEILPD